jgi:hypothetical protein
VLPPDLASEAVQWFAKSLGRVVDWLNENAASWNTVDLVRLRFPDESPRHTILIGIKTGISGAELAFRQAWDAELQEPNLGVCFVEDEVLRLHSVPLLPGDSIGGTPDAQGTLGGFVSLQGKVFGLTCQHVTHPSGTPASSKPLMYSTSIKVLEENIATKERELAGAQAEHAGFLNLFKESFRKDPDIGHPTLVTNLHEIKFYKERIDYFRSREQFRVGHARYSLLSTMVAPGGDTRVIVERMREEKRVDRRLLLHNRESERGPYGPYIHSTEDKRTNERHHSTEDNRTT